MHNIQLVTSSGTCSGCGSCVVVCPQNCISLKERDFNRPIVDEEICVKCKLCLKVCPSLEYTTYSKEHKSENIECLGAVSRCVVCHAADSQVRNKAASGGFITTLASCLLDQKLADGVICVQQDNDNPIFNKVIIAKSSQEVFNAAASRYSPASVCIPLKSILKEKGRFVFIGKPCDIAGLKKLQTIFPILKKNIFLTIGLFCHHTPSRAALYTILNSHGILPQDVTSIKFRGGGWPGNFELVCGDQVKVSMKYFEVWNKYFSNLKYIPVRCLLCQDVIAEQADFSVGDPWGKEFKEDNLGNSAVVIRNSVANQIYQKLVDEKHIISRDITLQDVMRYQHNLLVKKSNSDLWRKALSIQGKKNVGAISSLICEKNSLKYKLSVLKKAFILFRKVGEE